MSLSAKGSGGSRIAGRKRFGRAQDLLQPKARVIGQWAQNRLPGIPAAGWEPNSLAAIIVECGGTTWPSHTAPAPRTRHRRQTIPMQHSRHQYAPAGDNAAQPEKEAGQWRAWGSDLALSTTLTLTPPPPPPPNSTTMRSVFAFGVLAIARLSVAQYVIDPESVDQNTRDAWCLNQESQCPLICLQQPGVTTMTTIENECDPETLTYTCVCSNNVAPNITMYTQTIPYYICSEWGNQCVAGCGGANDCEDKCRSEHPCGAQTPNPPNSTILSMISASVKAATSTKTSGPTGIDASGFGGPAATTTGASKGNTGSAPAMMDLGQSYGLAVLFAGVFAGFAILL
ncbi:hypothetical protein P154DRAFT_537785 [Amniculicola lignicola CBS 123094]|uniref:DUF7707 domain-containing protein n=1 Tax=Amniculicola lignicola CBS 123094 TaxID=1392246 RepID=A0A6A5WGD6_9PLEO|nr:hypothetical protein P154DRAFT_537785 [Amniculicola lignicola CBS 123094]